MKPPSSGTSQTPSSRVLSHLALSPRELLLALAAIAVTLLSLRPSLWYVSGLGINTDLDGSFLPWLAFINAHGHLQALKDPIGDYLPGYYFLLALSSYLNPWIKPIAQVKLLPFLFDMVIAGLTYLTVDLLQAQDSGQESPRFIKPAFSAVLMLALPSLFSDGALWGQCDSIYISLLLASVYLLLRRVPAGCAFFFGLALAMKLQSTFLAPFFLAALLRRRLRLRDTAFAFLGLALPFLPALLAGRNPRTFLTLYLNQTREVPSLATDVGNPWFLAQYLNVPYAPGVVVGLIVGALAAAWLVIAACKERPESPSRLFFFATLTLLVMPYALPKMHERYFLPAEVFLVILACHQPRFLISAALLESALLIQFAEYFARVIRPINLLYAFVTISFALGLMLRQLRTDDGRHENFALH